MTYQYIITHLKMPSGCKGSPCGALAICWDMPINESGEKLGPKIQPMSSKNTDKSKTSKDVSKPCQE